VAEHHVDEAVQPAARPEGGLAQRAEVGVVLHQDGDTHPLLEGGDGVDLRLGAGHAQHHRHQPLSGDLRIPQDGEQHRRRRLEQGAQVVASRGDGLAPVGQDLPGRVRQGGAEAAVPQPDDGDDARGAGQLERPGRTPRPVRPRFRCDLVHAAAPEQLLDRAGHGGRGQAGETGQLRPGERSRDLQESQQMALGGPHRGGGLHTANVPYSN
jgi:hypothetical protein